MYVIDNNGDFGEDYPIPRAFAFKFLHNSFSATDTSFNWWNPGADSLSNFGPRLRGTPENPYRDFGTGGTGQPMGDVNAYYVLSHREWDYDQFRTATIGPDDTLWMEPPPSVAPDLADGIDARMLISIGPFNLPPDSSVRLLYATFTAEAVHYDPANGGNLPWEPDTFVANLDFTDMLANAAVSTELTDSLLDPGLPVIGLQIAYQDWDSAVIQWDPWVFEEVVGYEIYLSEISPDSLPYPGVPAPWLRPLELDLLTGVGRTHQHTLTGYDPHIMYFVNVANFTEGEVGDGGDPVFLTPPERHPAPTFAAEHVFTNPGSPITLDWEAPDGVDIDHYNIYRFPPEDSLAPRYHAFYDLGQSKETITPADSFFRDDQWYYYYAMGTYGQVDSQFTEYEEVDPLDGYEYIVTAVDKHGFESEFSTEVTLWVIDTPTHDVLFIHKLYPGTMFVSGETILDFYNWVLSGYDYDIYHVHDTLGVGGCQYWQPGCVDFHDLVRYRTIIIDDDVIENTELGPDETHNEVLTIYLLMGGKIVYFGGMGIFLQQAIGSPPSYRPADHEFITRFFGVDSIFYVGPGWELVSGDPVDSLYGLLSVSPDVPELPALEYNTDDYPFANVMRQFWPENSAPCASVFGVNENGTVTHSFEGVFPSSCLLQDNPIGVHTVTTESETYLFGFRLWYMRQAQARRLIASIMGFDCCEGLRGNFDGDPEDICNIVDLSMMVEYLFNAGAPPVCPEEGNVDGDPNERTNIVDLSYLVAHLFGDGPPPADCP